MLYSCIYLISVSPSTPLSFPPPFSLPLSLQVQLLKSLNHPNILQFIGILYKVGKVLVLITEYADGGTLRKTIKNTEKLFPWNLRISMARDIAAGMVSWFDRITNNTCMYISMNIHLYMYNVHVYIHSYRIICMDEE